MPHPEAVPTIESANLTIIPSAFACAHINILNSLGQKTSNIRKVLVLYVGGTVGMQKNSEEVYVPVRNAFFKTIKNIATIHDISLAQKMRIEPKQLVLPKANEYTIIYEIKEYDPLLDSSNMSVNDWIGIANDLKANYSRYDGFVVLHGTDTMAYTSAALSFMLENLQKPVILTGAQVPLFELISDARDNFVEAVFFAGSYSNIQEVCVYFAHQLFRGNRVSKKSCFHFDAFHSPNYHTLANTETEIRVHEEYLLKNNCGSCKDRLIVNTNLDRNVGSLSLFPTLTASQLECFLRPPIEGIVLQSYGSGNIPSNQTALLEVLENAVKREIVIINITLCHKGTVNTEYETGRALEKIGIISGNDMTPEAALSKLAYVLGKSGNYESRIQVSFSMGQDSLYLLETLIKKIVLRQNLAVTVMEDLVINIKFNHIVNYDIDFKTFTPPEALTVETGDQKITPNTGKSFLFVSRPSTLRQLLDVDPVQINLLEDIRHIAGVDIKLQKDFCEMVKLFESIGIVKSCSQEEVYDLFDENKKSCGTIALQLKMSCFGRNIQTSYQLCKGKERYQCFFRQRNTSKTFVVESMDVQTHPKGTTVNIQKEKLEKAQNLLKTLEGSVVYPGGEKPAEEEEEEYALTSEKIAKRLCGSKDCPAVQKFKEYGIGPLATGKGLGTLYTEVEPPVTYGMSHTYGVMHEYGPYGVFSRPKYEDLPFVPPKNDYDDEMKKNEANNKPLCTYCNKPPCSPPENSKRKKKHRRKTDFDHCPKKNCELSLRGGANTHVLRLRGGGENDEEREINNNGGPSQDRPTTSATNGTILPKSPLLECKSVMDQFDDILSSYRKTLGPCGQAVCPYAQTIAEETCRKVCPPKLPTGQDDDKSCTNVPCGIPECPYTSERKNKVFPAGCGSPRCAYAQYKLGLVDEDAELELQFLPPALTTNCGDHRCKYPPPVELPPIHWDCPDPLPKGQCKNPNCPFLPPPLRKFKTKELKRGPCGSPMCPYALPQPCGQPTCPFVPQPCPMPPPSCDIASTESTTVESSADFERTNNGGAQFKGTFEDYCPNKNGCGSGKKKKRRSREERTKRRSKTEDACANPGCINNEKEHKSKEVHHACENPHCPYGAKRSCDNPYCPKKQPPRSCPPAACPPPPGCPYPLCPFAQQVSCPPPACPPSPGCPYPLKPCPYVQQTQEIKKSSSQGSACSNPECIYNQEQKDNEDLCDNPDCPFAKKSRKMKKRSRRQDKGDDGSICSNPECTFNQNKMDNISICSNPECPASQGKNEKRSSKGNTDADAHDKGEGASICSNPDCPDAEGRGETVSICSNPDCPFSHPNSGQKRQSQQSVRNQSDEICEDPMCPYGLPMPTVCGVPNCPYDLMLQSQQNKKRFSAGGRVTEQDQGDNAAVMLPDVGNCEDNPETCDNPECVYYEDEQDNRIPMDQKKKKRKHGRRKKRGKFVYTIGDVYPGVKVGHKECVRPVFHVPPHMGWLWNIWTPILNLKPRRGWRPGALTKEIAARIKAHRRSKGLGMLHLPYFRKGGKAVDVENELKVVPKPTLHIQKKEGAYWITMNPLKDPNSLVENEDPYMDCTPMTFKITKNKKPDEGCYCDGEELPLSDSSDSELDIEFTPPAGIIHPERFKKRPNTICVPAQYDPADFETAKSKKKADKKGKGGKGAKGKKGEKGGKDKKKKKK